LCDRPRTPHRSPRATPREVVSKILYLRQRYHFGAGRIADYLQRFHQLKLARSSVHRILIRHGLNLLPANQKRHPAGRAWRRYEKPQPGHRLQLDVKFLERIAGTGKRLYQFTAIDDCTRIRVLKVYDACNQTSAIRFVDEVIRRLPFRVLVIQTDNGAEFQSRFHWHLEARDIRHVYIRPKTPHLNGKSNGHTASMNRSFISSWIKTALPTISTYSMTSFASGRIITITIDRTEPSMGRPHTSGSWQKPLPVCHLCLKTLQLSGPTHRLQAYRTHG
jgi:hypothetical protein